jgi:hypothetical protein
MRSNISHARGFDAKHTLAVLVHARWGFTVNGLLGTTTYFAVLLHVLTETMPSQNMCVCFPLTDAIKAAFRLSPLPNASLEVFAGVHPMLKHSNLQS